MTVCISVNSYNAARLELPIFKIGGFPAFEPTLLLSDAYFAMPIIKLSYTVLPTIQEALLFQRDSRRACQKKSCNYKTPHLKEIAIDK